MSAAAMAMSLLMNIYLLLLLQSLAMSASGQQLSNNTLVRKRAGANARNSQMSAESSNATVDSALYSNVR
jgi:hypothetical protein